MAGDLPTLLSMGPLRQKRSIMPMMSRLNTLLPNASPTARSGALTRVMELTPSPSSGREVAVASITTPMKERPSPVLTAMMSADLARWLDANRIIAAAMRSCVHSPAIDCATSIYAARLLVGKDWVDEGLVQIFTKFGSQRFAKSWQRLTKSMREKRARRKGAEWFSGPRGGG